MNRNRMLLLAGLIGTGFLAYHWSTDRPSAAKAAKQAQAAPCKAIVFEGSQFTECVAIPGLHQIATRITGQDGLIYRSFSALSADVDSKTIAFAMNAGMYDVRSRPIGYYAEGGERLQKLNRNKGDGNFHLLPNGVFFGETDGDWRVMTSDDFAASISKRPQFGTQSGPMLLINGKPHPKFSDDGDSLKIRNGVGVDAQGRAHFVISDDEVSFGRMARLMRDHVKAKDALFLDGTVSALWDPSTQRMDGLYPLGPLIVVTKVAKERAS